MYTLETRLFGIPLLIHATPNILDKSYPNTNYAQIARTNVEYFLSNIRNRIPDELEYLIQDTTSETPLLVISGHGSYIQQGLLFVGEVGKETPISLQSYLDSITSPISGALLLSCNPGILDLETPYPILGPKDELSVCSSFNYSEEFELVLPEEKVLKI